jgi:hypothetical protein
MSTPAQMQALASLVERLATQPFTCSMASIQAREIVGGTVLGYWAEDNPTAELGQTEGGHDFLVVEEKYILDIWAMAYYGKPLLLDLTKDAAEIKRLYGDSSKWEEPQEELFL